MLDDNKKSQGGKTMAQKTRKHKEVPTKEDQLKAVVDKRSDEAIRRFVKKFKPNTARRSNGTKPEPTH